MNFFWGRLHFSLSTGANFRLCRHLHSAVRTEQARLRFESWKGQSMCFTFTYTPIFFTQRLLDFRKKSLFQTKVLCQSRVDLDPTACFYLFNNLRVNEKCCQTYTGPKWNLVWRKKTLLLTECRLTTCSYDRLWIVSLDLVAQFPVYWSGSKIMLRFFHSKVIYRMVTQVAVYNVLDLYQIWQFTRSAAMHKKVMHFLNHAF